MAITLLDAIVKVLTEANGPMHSSKILERVHELDASVSLDEDGHYQLRVVIRKAIKQDAAAKTPRFVDCGRRMFCLGSLYNPSVHKTVTKAEQSRKFGDEKRPAAIPECERRCGNCRFISWYGPHFLTQQRGHCGNDENSGRPYVTTTMAACPFWKQRTRDQITADRREQAHDQALAGGGKRRKRD